ncbi:efflux RND transporter permease subunit [Actinotalea sp. K2]|uniref:efflux RND transporter permease subunit n=1 Tax=Actinotalea sp. K2 TaxID=2939438 RepID=UPI002017EF61|nr:efflux RND transporter permease subunit [Actinotalea sp. K2]MCL3861314.1 efflux RND transporter permease subunit [Actinotalea sp. K2]
MFRLARLSLANRSVVALATLAIAVFGVISAGSLKQELIPSLQIPTAVVVAVNPGASPQIIEQQVTAVIEDAVSGVTGVEEISSTSSTSVSTTVIELDYGQDLDAASQAIQQAVNRSSARLPEGVEPTVITGSIDDFPVVQLAATGGQDEAALAELLRDVVVPRLSEIDGVRDVDVTGAAEQRVLIDLDLLAAAAAGVDPAVISQVLQDNGVVLPVGQVSDGDTSLSVQVGSQITSVADLAGLPVITPTGSVVTLQDVADVSAELLPPTAFSRLDGEPALAVSVVKTPGGNTVEISHGVSEALAELAPTLGDVRIEAVFDQAPFIEESIEGLATEGGLGLVFAVVVILVFLLSIRSTLVAAISIPLSLLVTFISLQVFGFTLNILTLAAMTIAIGRVVDDSIVVIENINRHLSYGEERRDAIITGVREVATAISSSTIATVLVFAPVALVGGMVGELFRPFAITIGIAMGASLVVALTVVPVLAYWFIRPPKGRAEDLAATREKAERAERRSVMQRAYVPTLAAALSRPVVAVVLAVAVFGGTMALVPRLETSFLGDAGQDTLTVTETFEPGTSLEVQDAAARQVEEALADVAGIRTVQTTVGSRGDEAFTGGGGGLSATFAVTLEPDVDTAVVQEEVRSVLGDLPDVGDVTVDGGAAAFGSTTVDVLVQAADDDVLVEAAALVDTAVRATEGTTDVTNNLSAAQPTVQVLVDRDAAAAAGLTEQAVVRSVAGAMGAAPLGTVDLGAGQVDVELTVGDGPQTLAEIEALVLPTEAGPVPLAEVADVEVVDVPTSITRLDGERSATISATPAGQDLGALTTRLRAELDDLDLPVGASVTVGGVAAQQEESFADLGTALLIAIAIVYLIMVATFRSLVQPLILLVSVPFAATGAVVMLLATSTPLGVAALIGLLMLIGVVVTNAIVLIDLINQYREQGRELYDAITEGARKRLRPIVMTAAATIFALTPMAFGLTGGGVFISQPLALVVIGGLISSTLLTLVLVPTLYWMVERAKERRGRTRQTVAEPVTQGKHAAV